MRWYCLFAKMGFHMCRKGLVKGATGHNSDDQPGEVSGESITGLVNWLYSHCGDSRVLRTTRLEYVFACAIMQLN